MLCLRLEMTLYSTGKHSALSESIIVMQLGGNPVIHPHNCAALRRRGFGGFALYEESSCGQSIVPIKAYGPQHTSPNGRILSDVSSFLPFLLSFVYSHGKHSAESPRTRCGGKDCPREAGGAANGSL